MQNVFLRTWLAVSDALLRAIRRPSRRPTPARPKRILVCVGGHLGDAVISAAALADLHTTAPEADIGVLCASWNRKVLAAIPHIRRIHTVDHWKLNRAPVSFPRRMLAYAASQARAIRELRQIAYDAAVDLYPYYPNSATTLAMAGIPTRAGFGTGGFGPLYTHEVRWTEGLAVREDHQAALRALLPGLRAGHSTPSLGPTPESDRRDAALLLKSVGIDTKPYAVLHVGGGVKQRDWPIEHWIEVARQLIEKGVGVVLSGAGTSDASKTAVIQAAVPGVVNLCDRLPWPVFRPVVARAAVLLSVNTVAMHLAAAEGTPCVAVLSGIDASNRWHPGTPEMHQLSHPVSCAPCHRTRGCETMLCIRGITPDAMLAAAEPYLPTGAT